LRYIIFPENRQFKYDYTGKFEALSSEWKHEQFNLEDYELIVMTEGILYLGYGDDRFTVKKGEYLILPPSDGYREGFKEAYCSFYWAHFSVGKTNLPLTVNIPRENFDDLDGKEYIAIPQHGKIPRPEKMVVQMKQLQDIVKNEYPSMSINAMITSIVGELYGQLSVREPFYKDLAGRKQIYMDIIDYIQTNINRNLRISEIADVFGYNPKYLSHLFAEIRGIPLKQYILNQKIDAANFMLSDNDKAVTEIASELGFSDVHNFARAYKKITGLTPSEYRNAYAKRMLFHV